MSDPLVDYIGGKSSQAFRSAFGMNTVADLLWHIPRRYQQRGELTNISALAEGEDVTVLAEIVDVRNRRMARKRGSITEVVVSDGTQSLTLTFFNQQWRERELRIGRRGLFAGNVSSYRGARQLAHPSYVLLGDAGDAEVIESFAGEIIAIYSASTKVTTWDITRALDLVLPHVEDLSDPIPDEVRERRQLIALPAAFRQIHRPHDDAELLSARERLAFQEAFVLQSVLAQRRYQQRQAAAIARSHSTTGILAAFDARSPFTLTNAQVEAGRVIADDLAQERPMHRLLQGDVGSGKTLVALRAMLSVVDAGGQAALLAPTEVLATQHHATITAMLGDLAQAGTLLSDGPGTNVALLLGSQKTAERRQQLLNIVSGEAGIVIGTHALLQESVDFHDLGLVVVDEQHRFGVEQRAHLLVKARQGTVPHQLVMTATPIPRSVAMTLFGDLDTTVLDELPAGRQEVQTHVVSRAEDPKLEHRIWARMREEVEAGNRVFVVAPRIDAEDDDRASVQQVAEFLRTEACPQLQVGVLHGRMSADEKREVMASFAGDGGIEILVATTVIEVGIDVPTATMMVIMDADSFGISQLHQLRGRIGRGGLPGLCILLTEKERTHPAHERLSAVASTTDGFELAQRDLEFRREGDVLGSRQSGNRTSLRILDVLKDTNIINNARDEATAIIERDPDLASLPFLHEAVAELVSPVQADFLERG
jgi:ATP-dependent DNA helicase RecG